MRDKLTHALTQYDIKQIKKKYHNPYALGQYLIRLDDVMKDIDRGAKPREALIRAFSGSLLDACLKSIGEKKHDLDEKNGRIVYEPVK